MDRVWRWAVRSVVWTFVFIMSAAAVGLEAGLGVTALAMFIWYQVVRKPIPEHEAIREGQRRVWGGRGGARKADYDVAVAKLAAYQRDRQCVVCGVSEDLTVDHIIPQSQGGGDDPSNLQCLCRSCNSRKGARLVMPEYQEAV